MPKITSIIHVEIPSYGIVVEPGIEVELPSAEDVGRVLGVEKVTEAQVREVHEQILANPNIVPFEGKGKQKEETKNTAPENKESKPSQ